MKLSVRREEATYIRNLISSDRTNRSDEVIKTLYDDINIANILWQLDIIIKFGDSIDEEMITTED